MPTKSGDALQGMLLALDVAGIGAIVAAPGGVMSMINETATVQLGLAAFEPGQRVAEVVSDAALSDLFQMCEGDNNPATGEVQGAEGRVLRASVSPLPEVGSVALLRDVTYFYALEERRQQLASSIGHDIKNPLTAVQGYADLLPRFGDLNEKQTEFAGRIENSASRLIELVRDLIDLSWIEAGLEVDEGVVDLVTIASEVFVEQGGAAAERSQSLLFLAGDDSIMLPGNARRLHQMISHLAANAIKFTPEEGEVTVSVFREGQWAVVAVTDDGPGISDEDQKSLFERYFRAEPTRHFPGSGLGLAIVKAIAAQHGGEVGVESAEGKGSTFTVKLPAVP